MLAEGLLNAKSDINILLSKVQRDRQHEAIHQILEKRMICTMHLTRQLVLARTAYGSMKSPKLAELFYTLFGCAIKGAHDARQDVANLCRIVPRLHETKVLLLPRMRLHRRFSGVIK